MTNISYPKSRFYDFMKSNSRLCDSSCIKHNNAINRMIEFGVTDEDFLNVDERVLCDNFIKKANNGEEMSKSTKLYYRVSIRKYREYLEMGK